MQISRGDVSPWGGLLRPAVCGIAAVSLGAALLSTGAIAQTATDNSAPPQLTEIVVTGSHIARIDTETPSPIQVITADDLKNSGYTNTQEVLKNLTANGQGTLSQSFSGAFASGAAGVALRGLNVGYTLTLIDGHRMAPYPIGDDGQRSFVDIASIPFDSIERIEVLKDGASSAYGSDAIAGVVNIILKKSYQGASVTADGGTSSHGDGTTAHASAIFGMGDLVNDGHNFYIEGEYRHQQQIRFIDRGGIFTQTDYSAEGGIDNTLGVTNPLNGGLARSATGYILAPGTTNIAGFMPGCNATQYAAGQCVYHDTWDQIQPETTNYNVVGRYTQAVAEDWQVSVQGTYFESKSEQIGQPNRAFTAGFQGVTSGPGVIPTVLPAIGATTIPSTNPSFPTGTGLTEGLLRNTFLNVGPTETWTDSKSYRAIADLTGKIGTWNLDASLGYTEVKLNVENLNYVQPALMQAALDSTTAPFLVGQANTAAVNNSVAPAMDSDDSSKLYFAHVGTDTSVAQLPGGPLGLAFGADWYEREQYAVAPAAVEEGLLGSPYTAPSNNFTVGKQQVAAGYAELVAPIVKEFELDAAIRYDHYNLSGGKASPKVGFKWSPVHEFALRGTWAKGFRAPGPAENGQAGQTFFAGATNDPILCRNPATVNAPGNFVGQCVQNIATLQGTNPDLKPETSQSFTLGIIVEPFRDLSATLDLYAIEIKNQIVSGGGQSTVRGTNLTPIPMYVAGGGTVLTAPPVAPILYNTVSFINANRTFTDGFDVGVDYHHKFDSGWQYKSELTWSYTHEYEMTIDGTNYQLAGTHGPSFFTGDTGNPKSRVAWSNTVGLGSWSVTGTLNYISSFSVIDTTLIAFEGIPGDTCLTSLQNQGGAAGLYFSIPLSNGTIPGAVSCNVKHFTTFDLYGKWDVTEHLNLHGSVTNLFDTKAPLDWATYGGALGQVPWNPSLHLQGAIGAFFNVGVTYKFK